MENGNFPDGWTWTTIGNIADTTSGGTPLRSHPEYYGGNIPWLKSGELRDGIIRDAEENITDAGLKNSSAKYFSKDTVVVALYGATVGRTGILGFDATTNQAVCGISPRNNSFFSKYMFYWLQSQRQNLINQSAGGAQPNISQGIIRNLPFPLAPFPEQERIVTKIEELFTQLDAGTAALKRIQAGLKRYKASVLKAACEGRLLTDECRMGNDGGLPDGWTSTNLGQLKKFSLYGPRFSSKDYSENGISVLRTSDISESGKVNLEKAPKLPITDAEYEKYKCEIGDLLITRTGSIGTLAIFNDNVRAIPGAFLIQYRLNVPEITGWYIFYYFKSPTGSSYLVNKSAGVGRPNLNAPHIEEIPIPLPPLAEQRRIVAEVERRLSVVKEVESVVASSLARAGRLRQSVLKSAFEGKLG